MHPAIVKSPPMSQIGRVMQIDRLVRDGRAPSADELARQLDVSKRQIYGDRQYLIKELGAPLRFDRKRGGWIYTDHTWVLPTAILTEGELLAFFLSVEIARSVGNSGLKESLADAARKIARSLGEVVSVDLIALRDAMSFGDSPAARVNAQIAMTLARAQSERRKVSLRYASASSGQTKWRVVHPYHLHLARGEWLLLAFDEDRGELRSFNAHRIQELVTLPVHFLRDPDFNLDQTLRSMLWAEAGERVFDVALFFDAYQARFIRERSWHPDQRLEPQGGGALILHFPASGLNEVARWVLGYGKHARVLEPPELMALVKEHIEEMARIYGEGGRTSPPTRGTD